MSDWPLTGGCRVLDVGALTTTSSGTIITAAASANTKGAWTQLVASSAVSATAVMIVWYGPTAPSLLDIGIGASGSETVLVPDIHHTSPAADTPCTLLVPVSIPAGSRIAARLACSTASSGGGLILHLIGGGFDQPSARSLVRTYGATAASSRGTSVDPGATANTKGSWTQIVASTTEVTKALIIAAGNQGNTAAANASWLADIGIGASGSETVLVPNYRIATTTSNVIGPPFSPPLPLSIPAGSRIAIRSQCSITDTTDRRIDFLLHAIS